MSPDGLDQTKAERLPAEESQAESPSQDSGGETSLEKAVDFVKQNQDLLEANEDPTGGLLEMLGDDEDLGTAASAELNETVKESEQIAADAKAAVEKILQSEISKGVTQDAVVGENVEMLGPLETASPTEVTPLRPRQETEFVSVEEPANTEITPLSPESKTEFISAESIEEPKSDEMGLEKEKTADLNTFELAEQLLSDKMIEVLQGKINSEPDLEKRAGFIERLAVEKRRRELELLLKGEVQDEIDLQEKLGKKIGVTQPRVMNFGRPEGAESDLEAVYKPQLLETTKDAMKNAEAAGFTEGEYAYQREWLNGQVDRILGLDIVPPTIIRDGELGPGSVQMWTNESKGKKQRWYDTADRAQIEALAALDVLSGNFDRPTWNFVVGENGDVAAIDNGYTFLPNEYLTDGEYQGTSIVMRSRPLAEMTQGAAGEFIASGQARMDERFSGMGVSYLKNYAEGPKTALSEALRDKFALVLEKTDEGQILRDQLKQVFTAALGERAPAMLEEFMTRLERLHDQGFDAYVYPELQGEAEKDKAILEGVGQTGTAIIPDSEATGVAKIQGDAPPASAATGLEPSGGKAPVKE